MVGGKYPSDQKRSSVDQNSLQSKSYSLVKTNLYFVVLKYHWGAFHHRQYQI